MKITQKESMTDFENFDAKQCVWKMFGLQLNVSSCTQAESVVIPRLLTVSQFSMTTPIFIPKSLIKPKKASTP